jgi:hypothetical protein
VGELSTSFWFFSRFPRFFANFSPVDLLHFPPKTLSACPGVSPSVGSDPSRRPTTAWRHTSSSSAAVSVGAWWMTSWSLRCWWACSNHRRSEKHWDRTYIEGVQKWMVYIYVYIIVENPVKIDDLGVPPLETSKWLVRFAAKRQEHVAFCILGNFDGKCRQLSWFTSKSAE